MFIGDIVNVNVPVQGFELPQAARFRATLSGASRRTLLRLLVGAGLFRLLTPQLQASKPLPVEQLLSQYSEEPCRSHQRRFRAHAYVHLFALPIFSRQDVGGGYAVVELSDAGDRTIECLQFAGGSSGERTHGLNRVGLIQEAVVAQRGTPLEAAYFGFMVFSGEKNLDQARKSLQADNANTIPYAAASGSGRAGYFHCTVSHLPVASHYNWSTFEQLNEDVRFLIPGSRDTRNFDVKLDSQYSHPETFLHSMRRAILSPGKHTAGAIVYNGKRYRLNTDKQPDKRTGQQMALRGVTHQPDSIWRLNGTTTETATGETSAFQVWYESGDTSGIPVRIEFYPKSFLKLVFEQTDAQQGPPKMTYLLKNSGTPRMEASR